MEALSNETILYPEDDGKRLAENTAQLHWIVVLESNLSALFPEHFVAADLLWYAMAGQSAVCTAPDVMVVLGRPKGGRGSYKQWEEGGIAPQVVFEVLSPGNTSREMEDKLSFYERYGVEEYYVIDPVLDDPTLAILEVRVRRQGKLTLADFGQQYISRRLGVRFVRKDGRLTVYRPDGVEGDGQPFRTLAEILVERDAAKSERDAAKSERDEIAKRLDSSEAKAARLAEKLRAMGIDPTQIIDEG